MNREAPVRDRRDIRGALFRQREQPVRFTTEPPPPEPVHRPAHVARMLALAHHLNTAVERGVVADHAALARKLGLTRARLTQLLDLTLLAPDLQSQVLELEAVNGVEPLRERQLRAMVAAGTWPQQRAAWATLNQSKVPESDRDRGRPVRLAGDSAPTMKSPSPNPDEARAAFAAVADQIASLRLLSLPDLERKHLEILGFPGAIRSRDALIKKISLALQRQVTIR